MNLESLLNTIRTQLHIIPYKGNVYIREGELEAILKIAYEAGIESVTKDVAENTKVDTKKRSKV